MARLKGTGHVLGQQVHRWIQKGLGAVFAAIPHPIAVDAARVQGNGPWVTRAPVLSFFGEGRSRGAEEDLPMV